MLEAYLASIFVDSDFDYDVVEEFYSRHIKPFFIDMSLYDTFANKHPVVRHATLWIFRYKALMSV